MTGPFDSVIGMNANAALARFTSYKGRSLTVAKKDVWLCGTYMSIQDDGTCSAIRRVQVRA